MVREMRRPIEQLFRPALRSLKPYQAIVLPGARKDDGASGRIIKLDGNENVYGCSPRVKAALASLDRYHLYPDAEQRRLRNSLAEYTGLPAEHIVAGSGSDELIDLLMRLFLDSGDKVIDCAPTFSMYSFNTGVCGGQVTVVPRDEEYRLDINGILGAIDERTKIMFVATPNNPTGTLTPREDILKLLETDILVVVDEAYYEFCGATVADLVPHYENLVVLRTFSKWAGLAGLRVGYGLFPPAIARTLMVMKPPYNINAAAELAAIESLADREYLMGTVRRLVDERDRLFIMLRNLNFTDPVPSEANFVLCKILDRDAKEIQQGLRRKGIFIRHYETPLLSSFIRISAGKPEDTDAVIRELRAWEGMV